MRKPYEVGDIVYWRDIPANHIDYPDQVGFTATIKEIHSIGYADTMDGEPVFWAVDVELSDGSWEWGLYCVRFALDNPFVEPSWEL